MPDGGKKPSTKESAASRLELSPDLISLAEPCKNSEDANVKESEAGGAEKHWELHKPMCGIIVEHMKRHPGHEEPLLDRHLRHWTLRFEATILRACIRALNLKHEWDRIEKEGLVILLQPRPHANLGARLRIKRAGVFKHAAIRSMLDALGGGGEHHDRAAKVQMEHRQRLQERTHGWADQAYIFIIARNDGPDAFEGRQLSAFRVLTTAVYKPQVISMPTTEYDGDWLQDLKDQTHNDRPLQHGPLQEAVIYDAKRI
ncbi:hypothetical protein GGX14DRAFT_407665 [Mycena pura]|uniref:Uncharacterized protein n=1 Tax=Mycena pura TaxID=153505 RepID=A0AAD6UMH7_9AGAR|nr:hypothetical protein GGX14DRAFT_407665 [Mycena pura]